MFFPKKQYSPLSTVVARATPLGADSPTPHEEQQPHSAPNDSRLKSAEFRAKPDKTQKKKEPPNLDRKRNGAARGRAEDFICIKAHPHGTRSYSGYTRDEPLGQPAASRSTEVLGAVVLRRA